MAKTDSNARRPRAVVGGAPIDESGAAMSENRSAIAISSEKFNRATLRLSGARALIATLGVLVSESSEIEVTGNLMGDALQGISYLLEDVDAALLAEE